MAIDVVDWTVFSSFALLVIFLVNEEKSAVFDFLAGLMTVILAAVLDENVFAGASDLVRYGTFVCLIAVSIMLFARGLLRIPSEAHR